MRPPVAKTIAHETEVHGHHRSDPYAWLKNKDDPEVIVYLEAENAYTEHEMAHTEALQKIGGALRKGFRRERIRRGVDEFRANAACFGGGARGVAAASGLLEGGCQRRRHFAAPDRTQRRRRRTLFGRRHRRR